MTTESPNPAAEWWTTTEVAAYLDVSVSTVSGYRRRGQMPEPDSKLGSRTWLWRPGTIINWQQNRPRVGARGEEGQASDS
ncbi:helix-turn-helix transcriptional regulator [Pseudonocardia sp. RS010]|uniref:helix-turn-helix transcriptional regulator n=1 Tax=Pseudonocardia sp. RS010 TaxID=3385979 RepID=UPI0039A1B3C7